MGIELKGEVIREGGQWKIRLFMDRWIIDDILRDNLKIERTVITLHEPYPGATSYYSHRDGNGKSPKVISIVLFEEIDKE